jgi:hypothetical protein
VIPPPSATGKFESCVVFSQTFNYSLGLSPNGEDEISGHKNKESQHPKKRVLVLQDCSL